MILHRRTTNPFLIVQCSSCAALLLLDYRRLLVVGLHVYLGVRIGCG